MVAISVRMEDKQQYLYDTNLTLLFEKILKNKCNLQRFLR
jgi:hypothetical protein